MQVKVTSKGLTG